MMVRERIPGGVLRSTQSMVLSRYMRKGRKQVSVWVECLHKGDRGLEIATDCGGVAVNLRDGGCCCGQGGPPHHPPCLYVGAMRPTVKACKVTLAAA